MLYGGRFKSGGPLNCIGTGIAAGSTRAAPWAVEQGRLPAAQALTGHHQVLPACR